MFSIQFCIGFYSILYVCHCHFIGTINENCTKKNAIILENNLYIINRIEAILSQNNITVKYIAENVSKIYLGKTTNNQQQTTQKYNKDDRVKIVIRKKIKVTEKKNSINYIDKGLINKNYSIFGIDLTLYDVDIKNQFVTKKISNTDDYLETSIDKSNQTVLIEDTGLLNIHKNDTVEEQSTIKEYENITENVAKIFQNNGMNKNVPKYDLPKNIKSDVMTKNVHKYDSTKNVKQLSELIEDNETFIIPKKDIVEEQSTMIKNENISENVAKIFQNNGMDKNVPKYDLPNNIENNDMTKNVSKYDSTKTVKRLSDLIEDNVEFTIPKRDIKNQFITKKISNTDDYLENSIDKRNQSDLIEDTAVLNIPKNDTVEEQSTINEYENITENVTVGKFFQNMDKNVPNHDSPKNVQKRDIGIPENAANNYMPEVFQNHDAKNHQKYDLHKTIENYEKPKNIHRNFNDVKPYNYQNDEMNYKTIIYEKDMSNKDKNTRKYDDNASQNVRPQYQTRLNNDLVKKSLDDFKMVRRKTHFTMPDVKFKNDIAERDIDRYQDLAYPKIREYDIEATLNGARNHAKHIEDIRNNIYPSYSELNHKYQSYEDQNDMQMSFFKELNKIIARQKNVIRKIDKTINRNSKKGSKTTTTKKETPNIKPENSQIDRQRQQNLLDFQNLMSEVEAKQKMLKKLSNYTKFTFENTAKTTTKLTTTEKPTTILTLFDETEVRLALKNDPHVKRILKIANLKREKYLNNVRRYLTRHNYSHDTEYAMNLEDGANGLRTEAAGTLVL